MAETDFHRKLLNELVEILDDWFRNDPKAYVSGNLLLFYEEGNKRRHVSPDVFVVFGVPKGDRPNYLLWEEGHGPNVVIGNPFVYDSSLHAREGFADDETQLGVQGQRSVVKRRLHQSHACGSLLAAPLHHVFHQLSANRRILQ